jgi:hypothetical protein
MVLIKDCLGEIVVGILNKVQEHYQLIYSTEIYVRLNIAAKHHPLV